MADPWDPDGDGVPNLWDEDNDGDQVPDSLDLSPFARTSYTDAFSLNIQGGGFDGYAYVEIQVQPENLDHLHYSTTLLDWPYDELGQIMDLDDSPEDIRLLSMLKVRTSQAPDKALARRYGVTVFEDHGAYDLYMFLSPIGDGGRVGDVCDNCPTVHNPDQTDSDGDGDGLGYACEPIVVGGVIVPLNKLKLLSPWLEMTAMAALAALTIALVKKRRS